MEEVRKLLSAWVAQVAMQEGGHRRVDICFDLHGTTVKSKRSQEWIPGLSGKRGNEIAADRSRADVE